MNIRQATPADARIIADFNTRIAEETEHRHLELQRVLDGVTALLQDAGKGIYYVAESDGKVAGQLLVTYEWSDWRNGNFWWIQSVYVDKPFRGKGIFRALFGHVLHLAKKRNDVCGLRLYMDSSNAVAKKSYERLGMKRTDYEVFEMDFVLPED